jgi:nucleoid-associated protein YgaU
MCEHMFVRLVSFSLILLVILFLALGAARPSRSAAPETRYVVRAGDTLWAIAAARYGGDPREAVWRIKERNRLATSLLVPGMVLALPAS